MKLGLSKQFGMKDLGEAQIRSGLQIQHSSKTGRLSNFQTHYTFKILTGFRVNCPGLVDHPIVGYKDVETIVTGESNLCGGNSFPNHEVIGSLIYLMIDTCADFAFAAGKLVPFAKFLLLFSGMS